MLINTADSVINKSRVGVLSLGFDSNDKIVHV